MNHEAGGASGSFWHSRRETFTCVCVSPIFRGRRAVAYVRFRIEFATLHNTHEAPATGTVMECGTPSSSPEVAGQGQNRDKCCPEKEGAPQESTFQAFAEHAQRDRRGRDSNPRYGDEAVQRFSKPSLSAAQPPLHEQYINLSANDLHQLDRMVLGMQISQRQP
jgi:hypothetical protein